MKSKREQKQQLRARFRRWREDLDADSFAEKSRAIIARAIELDSIQQAGTVLAYWPREERREVDTRPLLQWLLERGARVALPVIDTFTCSNGEPSTPEMHAVLFEGEQQLRRNKWGVYEPVDGPTVPSSDVDVVIVPAFGAGRNGHRIGHGKGYYDVYLAGTTAAAVCLVYASCLIEAVPAEPHDVPVDSIVTEEETVHIRKARTRPNSSPSSSGSS